MRARRRDVPGLHSLLVSHVSPGEEPAPLVLCQLCSLQDEATGAPAVEEIHRESVKESSSLAGRKPDRGEQRNPWKGTKRPGLMTQPFALDSCEHWQSPVGDILSRLTFLILSEYDAEDVRLMN